VGVLLCLLFILCCIFGVGRRDKQSAGTTTNKEGQETSTVAPSHIEMVNQSGISEESVGPDPRRGTEDETV